MTKDARGRKQGFDGKWRWRKKLPAAGGGHRARQPFKRGPAPCFTPCCAICAGTHPFTCETYPA